MQDVVKITPKALEQIQKLRKSLQISEDQYLRIGVRGGGTACMGMNHVIAFDKKRDDDELHQAAGMDILIRKGESMYVIGMEVDYVDEAESKGFVFRSWSTKKSRLTISHSGSVAIM